MKNIFRILSVVLAFGVASSALAADEVLILTDGYMALQADTPYKTKPIVTRFPGMRLGIVKVVVEGRYCNLELGDLEFQTSTRSQPYRAYRIGNGEFDLSNAPVETISLSFIQRGTSYVRCDISYYHVEKPTQPSFDVVIEKSETAKYAAGIFALDLGDHPGYDMVKPSVEGLYSQIRSFMDTIRAARDVQVVKGSFMSVDDRFTVVTREFYRAHADVLDENMMNQFLELKDHFESLEMAVDHL